MRFQVISKDAYGQTSILATVATPEEALEKVREGVNTENDSQLTLDEKKANWQAYGVEVLDKKGNVSNGILYGGTPIGKHIFYIIKNGKAEQVNADIIKNPLRFFIGSVVKKVDKVTREKQIEEIFAEEIERKTRKTVKIASLDNQNLQDKMMVFVKVI